MRKIKEVLRLRFELRLGQREIARACSISQGAVHNYLKRAAVAGIAWPLPEGWDEHGFWLSSDKFDRFEFCRLWEISMLHPPDFDFSSPPSVFVITFLPSSSLTMQLWGTRSPHYAELPFLLFLSRQPLH